MLNKKELLEISEQLHTQDNLCTCDPMFCVQEKMTVYGMDPQFSDDPVWFDSEEGGEVHEPADGEETDTITKTGKAEYWETRMVAFTRAGCEEYIRQNGHNHSGELKIYVESFRRCPEMIAIRNFLMSLKKEKVEPRCIDCLHSVKVFSEKDRVYCMAFQHRRKSEDHCNGFQPRPSE